MGFFTDLITVALEERALKQLGLIGYKDITYEGAVKMILGEIFELARLSPSEIYKSLQPAYGEAVKFHSQEEEKKASLDLSIAIISYELIFIRELYRGTDNEDIAPKIHKWFLKLIESGENGKYAKEELETYLSFYEDYVNRDPAFKEVPFLSPDFDVQIKKVVKRLIQKLYGDTIEDRKLVDSEPLTLVEFFRIFILKAGGRWEKIFKGYALSE